MTVLGSLGETAYLHLKLYLASTLLCVPQKPIQPSQTHNESWDTMGCEGCNGLSFTAQEMKGAILGPIWSRFWNGAALSSQNRDTASLWIFLVSMYVFACPLRFHFISLFSTLNGVSSQYTKCLLLPDMMIVLDLLQSLWTKKNPLQ